ncbi:hypothetical protein QTP81_00155 [Alteromonas sp. ASW11-36]|uniref:Tetratricopeptide repeat protein n=1 Tax=Alteromonas arenosi TaxID=3055817 RepID=A0ABT7SS52_9ALTE|nr:hypothetical protein [Alteromonas sp. ASW11-36]MDM7859012.1 hypothetical protein [Alteromonas sp. ASW11-36]
MQLRSVLLGLGCLLVVGCQSTAKQVDNQAPLVNNELTQLIALELQSNEYTLQSPSQILALTNNQKQQFLDFFNAPVRANIAKHRRLYRYIDNLYVDFDYLGETLNAETAFREKKGNCMSLAILTSALAQLAGLEVDYQRVNVAPIYQRFNNVMTLSTHVRTHLYAEAEDNPNEITVIRSRLIIDYYPQRSNIKGDMLTDGEFFAMYYRNLASDAIILGQFEFAYAAMRMAIEQAPDDPENINTMAVVLRNMGLTDRALALYSYGIEQTEASLNLIGNYAQLLSDNGELEKSEMIKKQMRYSNDDNPYQWLDNAHRAIRENKHFLARTMLEKTLERAPYMHEAYFALAQSYYLTQDIEQADKALRKASELAYLPDTERLYEAKRRVLALVE